jgi:hypothetical protein
MTSPPVRGIDALLLLADNGQYQPDLMARNAALIEELRAFSAAFGGVKAKGKLKIEIDYTVDRFGQIEIVVGDTVTRPKSPKSKGTAWTDEDGELTIANPNQTRFEVRDITNGQREFRVPGSN